jgi:hypothetical protein
MIWLAPYVLHSPLVNGTHFVSSCDRLFSSVPANGCASLQRNTEKCVHCGHVFVRHEQIPFITRSDRKTFHLSLVSKPDLRAVSPRGFPPEHMLCIFAYAHDRTESQVRFIVVIILGSRVQVGCSEMEDVADALAELLESGKKPKAAYMVGSVENVPLSTGRMEKLSARLRLQDRILAEMRPVVFVLINGYAAFGMFTTSLDRSVGISSCTCWTPGSLSRMLLIWLRIWFSQARRFVSVWCEPSGRSVSR